eukprot:COSAG01_NODE_55600_length_324_cov_0.564444_1_plen_101_part_01
MNNIGNRSEHGKTALVAAGAAEAVVKAMQAHASMVAVQEAGCKAVINLCNDDGREALVSAGGAAAVVGALRAHPTVAAVQEQCGEARDGKGSSRACRTPGL